ncbi:MAG: GIY-YIG nuclease family protein [Chitinophagaceae bacterium]|nr:GIY-YIG nuclease family protein [Chitinophagaceae bacterium]
MYFVYILYSQKCNRYYIGYSANVKERLLRHNAGYVTATKNCIPYQLMASKAFSTEQEAMQEEKKLKRMKSRIYLQKLIAGNWQARPDLKSG